MKNFSPSWAKLLRAALLLGPGLLGRAWAQTPAVQRASLAPAANARTASTTTTVAVPFSQPIDPATAGNIKVFSQRYRGRRTATASTSGSTVTLTPTAASGSAAFRPGETLFVTVPTTVQSTSSVAAARYVYQFTTAVGGTGRGNFLPPATNPTPSVGSGPNSIAVGDVDSDGDLDMLTLNRNSNSASVRLNDGTGSFSGGSDLAVGSFPTGLVLGDVDGDGDLDLLASNANNSTVSVRLNDGAGSFSGGSDPAVGSSPFNLAVGDVDSDGDLDLLCANGSNTVGVRLNDGAGNFSGGSNPAVGNFPYSVAVGDVDGDGDLDLLTANYSGNTVSVRLNNGAGSFSGGSDPAVGASPQQVVLGDVDGDGDLDLLTANQGTNTVSVRLNDGAGNFTAPATNPNPTVGSNPHNMALGDVDGDGDLDLIAANSNSNSASVRLNNGTGSFTGGSDLALGVGSSPNDVAVGDVDGDGDLDILVPNYYNNSVSVRLNVQPPAITSLSPTSGSAGTSVTLTGTDLAGATAITFAGSSGNVVTTGFTVNGAGTQITGIVVPSGAATGTLTVTTPFGTSVASTQTFTVVLDVTVSSGSLGSPVTLSGSYNSITVTSSGVAQLTGSTVVGSAVSVSGTLLTNCQALTGAASFTLAAGATLGICDAAGISSTAGTGAVQTTGTRSFSTDASYLYNGTGAQQTGNALPTTVRNLTTTNSANLTLTAPTSVAQALTVAGSGNFVLNGQALTLLSDASGTALVVNSGTGTVTGSTAAVQRYLTTSAGLGYHHYTSPVSGNTLADLTTAGYTPVFNAAFNTSPTPATVQPFPTVQGYNQARMATAINNLSNFDKGWYSPLATDAMPAGQGFTVNLAGTEKVDFVGTLRTGNYTVSLARTTGSTAADGGWALVGNPYPASLDWSAVAPADRPNLDASMYVFESSGAYTGNYRAYTNGVGQSPLIASSQGFFVRVSSGQSSGLLTFRNSQRSTSYASQVPMRRGNTDPRPQLHLTLTGAGHADDAYLYAEAGATAETDAAYDAAKLLNTTGLNLASLTAMGAALAIDGRPVLAGRIPLSVAVPAKGSYTFTATLANLPATTALTLTDVLTGQTIDLRRSPAYTFTATATAPAAGRFFLNLTPAGAALATAAEAFGATVAVYPNPATAHATVLAPAVAGAETLKLTLLNALGQVVRTQTAALPTTGAALTLDVADLARGVYTVRLTAGSIAATKRLVLE